MEFYLLSDPDDLYFGDMIFTFGPLNSKAYAIKKIYFFK